MLSACNISLPAWAICGMSRMHCSSQGLTAVLAVPYSIDSYQAKTQCYQWLSHLHSQPANGIREAVCIDKVPIKCGSAAQEEILTILAMSRLNMFFRPARQAERYDLHCLVAVMACCTWSCHLEIVCMCHLRTGIRMEINSWAPRNSSARRDSDDSRDAPAMENIFFRPMTSGVVSPAPVAAIPVAAMAPSTPACGACAIRTGIPVWNNSWALSSARKRFL
jgi:hypothetical protein